MNTINTISLDLILQTAMKAPNVTQDGVSHEIWFEDGEFGMDTKIDSYCLKQIVGSKFIGSCPDNMRYSLTTPQIGSILIMLSEFNCRFVCISIMRFGVRIEDLLFKTEKL